MNIIKRQRHKMSNAELALLDHLTMSKNKYSDCFDYEVDYKTETIFIFCSDDIKQAFELAKKSNSFQYTNFILAVSAMFNLDTDSNSEKTSD